MSLAPVGLPNMLPADVLAELKETATKLCAPGTSSAQGKQQPCKNVAKANGSLVALVFQSWTHVNVWSLSRC